MRFLTIVILMNVLSHGLLATWLFTFFPRARRYKRRIALVVVALAVMPWIARFENRRNSSRPLVVLHAIGMTEQMVVVFGALPMAAFMGARALGRLAARRLRDRRTAHGGRTADAQRTDSGQRTPDSGQQTADSGQQTADSGRRTADGGQRMEAGALSRRDAVTRLGGALSWGMTAPLLGWGLVRGRHGFVVEEVVVRLPKLPRTLDGYTIVQVSDVHAGTFVDDRELAEGLALAAGVRPDLLVVTGDLVDFDAAYMEVFLRRLGALSARDGKLFILGNHDYYAGANHVVGHLQRAGQDLLMNASRVVRPGDKGGIAILGVDDLWAKPDLDRALTGVPEDTPRILLAHQPLFFDWAVGRVDLQLSGHTHGGQVNPGFRPADYLMKYVSGRYERNGSVLWVNRGFGVAAVPARIGAPPEITKIVLVAT